MRWLKWTGIAAAALMIASCFMEWVALSSRNISVSGVNAEGTDWGKPGYLHLVLTVFFVLCTLIPKIGAKRANLLVTALNLAWALRNFFMISSCSAGECPEKHTGLYLVLIASVLMLVSAMFPDIKLPESSQKR